MVCMQVEPSSVAGEDGRIREGDQIIQVNTALQAFGMLQ